MADAPRRFAAIIALLAVSLGLFLGSLIAQDAAPDGDDSAESKNAARDALLESSPLPIQPETAPELFEAMVLMVDLARPELARAYFDKFLELKPTDEVLINLRQKFGPTQFLKLSNIQELKPDAGELLAKVNKLMADRAGDPVRIAKLVDDLQGSTEQRLLAMGELKNGGRAVVVPLLNILRKNSDAKRQRDVLYVLAQIGPLAESPLVAALEMPGDDLRAGLISVLGFFGSRQTLDNLWFYANAPNSPEGVRVAAREAIAKIAKVDADQSPASPTERVAKELHRLARLHYRGEYRWKVDRDGKVSLWVWKREAETVARIQVAPLVASNIVGSKFARQALALSPENHDIQVLFLSMALTAEGMLAGWDKPLPTGPGTAYDLAIVVGEDVVADVLTEALKGGRILNAVAALRVLGQIGTLRLIRSIDAGRSPVLSALNYPETRVQFAAVGTIMQLDPRSKFLGADRAISILARALTGRGKPVALVVDPNISRASKVAGMLNELGYAPEVKLTGRDGFTFAAENADVEIAFVHPNTIRWELTETIANFRADSRTASIPIILQGPMELAGRMHRHIENNALVTYLVASATTAGLQSQLLPYLDSLAAPPLNERQRADQAAVASYWLAHIAEGQRTKIYNLNLASDALLAAVEDANLAENCLLALGALATRASQAKMAKILLEDAVSAQLRATAALQLAYHIQRHGLVVSKEQIAQIHALWERPGDPALHTAIGSVIGSLRPNSRLVGERLQSFEEQPALELLQK